MTARSFSRANRRRRFANCGHRGADFPQFFEVFEQQLLPNDPDLVIYAMVLNDVAQTPEFGARYPTLNDWIVAPREEIDLTLPCFTSCRNVGV